VELRFLDYVNQKSNDLVASALREYIFYANSYFQTYALLCITMFLVFLVH